MIDEDENPFSTKFIRPGAVDYLFPDGANVEQFVARLEQNGWRGEIVGPHGSGKSTLLAALLPAVAGRGWTVRRIDLHDGQRRLPRGWLREAASRPRTLLVIDGYEQLARWERWRIAAVARRAELGLLVTAHAPVGLPGLWTTEVDLPRAQALLAKLLPNGSAPVSARDLEAALSRHPTDLRAAWFDLYDLYETRRRDGLASD